MLRVWGEEVNIGPAQHSLGVLKGAGHLLLPPTLPSLAPCPRQIVSRGAIVSAHWVTRSYSTVISVPITHALVPAFRLVAYYHLNGQVVANAVWIDVEDSCEGKVLARGGGPWDGLGRLIVG